jgi:hypothetical protein
MQRFGGLYSPYFKKQVSRRTNPRLVGVITDKCFNVQIKHETVRVLHYLGRLSFKRAIVKLRNVNSRRPDAESL